MSDVGCVMRDVVCGGGDVWMMRLKVLGGGGGGGVGRRGVFYGLGAVFRTNARERRCCCGCGCGE